MLKGRSCWHSSLLPKIVHYIRIVLKIRTSQTKIEGFITEFQKPAWERVKL
jgi:hypothetical protein